MRSLYNFGKMGKMSAKGAARKNISWVRLFHELEVGGDQKGTRAGDSAHFAVKELDIFPSVLSVDCSWLNSMRTMA